MFLTAILGVAFPVIINLLALELEDRDAMIAFTDVYKKMQEDSSLSQEETSASKIILDS